MKIIAIFSLFILAILPVRLNAQSETIGNWAEKNQGFTKLCFYPTTLRMINLNHDSSFNTIIKDIKKLKIVMVSDKKLIKQGDILTLKQGIRAEDYKDMVQMRQGKNSFTIFVKENHEKPVGFTGIIDSNESLVVIDLEGYISPEVIQQLISGKLNPGALSKIYDISQLGNNNQKKPKK
jgi:hypothetical protein